MGVFVSKGWGGWVGVSEVILTQHNAFRCQTVNQLLLASLAHLLEFECEVVGLHCGAPPPGSQETLAVFLMTITVFTKQIQI